MRMCFMNQKPLVSVIIPVYNAEDYIQECVDSIINQTFDNLEIILVDDSSPDSSPQICDDYLKKDSRVKVVHKEHGGVSDTRNVGLNICKGEYVYFLDSDDFIDKTTIESLLAEAQYNSADVVFFDSKIKRDTDKLRYPSNTYLRRGSYLNPLNGIDMLSRLEEYGEYRPVVWLLFIRRCLLTKHKLYFYPGIIYEDELFTLRIFLNSNKVVHLPQPLHTRRIRENSIMTGGIRPYNFISISTVASEMIEVYLNEAKSEKSREVVRSHINNFLNVVNNRYFQLSLINRIDLFKRYQELIEKLEIHNYLNSCEIKEKCLKISIVDIKKEIGRIIPKRMKNIIKRVLFKEDVQNKRIN